MQEMNPTLHEPMETNPLTWMYLLSKSLALRSFYTVFGKRHPDPDAEKMASNDDGEGLAVILHGYGASRNHFANQVEAFISKKNSMGEDTILQGQIIKSKYRMVYAPHVNYDPDSTILASNTNVLGTIFNFCSDHPGEFIDLIGISAGGRLAVSLLFALRRQEVRIRVVTMASPLHGTSIVRLLPGFHRIARWTVEATLVEEFDPEQKEAHADLAENVALAESSRTFLHFYSTSDWLVFPPHRCTTAVGPPWAYSKALHACAHHEIFEGAMRSTELWDFLR